MSRPICSLAHRAEQGNDQSPHPSRRLLPPRRPVSNIIRIRRASPLPTGLVQPWVQSKGSFHTPATPINVGLIVFSCEVLCSFPLNPQIQQHSRNRRCLSLGKSTSRPMKSHCGVWHQYLALRNRPECLSRMAHNCLLSQVPQSPPRHSADMGIGPSRCHLSLFSRMSYQRSSSRS